MGKVISIINMKGGVGKTTLSIGICDYLSQRDKKILLIDADPQFNATQAMIDDYFDREDDESNYYYKEILPHEKTINKLFKQSTDILQEVVMPKPEDIIISLRDNFDILCGDLNLMLLNKSADYTNIRKLQRFITDNDLKNKYNYIIIDCPPTLTIYTDSALMASDYYLIPNRIDRYSIIGIESLQKAVNNLVSQERLNLKCLGLVYTMIQKGLKKQENLRTEFESNKVVNDLYIFSSTMSVANNVSCGMAGTNPMNYKLSSEDIEAISLELLDVLAKEH